MIFALCIDPFSIPCFTGTQGLTSGIHQKSPLKFARIQFMPNFLIFIQS